MNDLTFIHARQPSATRERDNPGCCSRRCKACPNRKWLFFFFGASEQESKVAPGPSHLPGGKEVLAPAKVEPQHFRPMATTCLLLFLAPVRSVPRSATGSTSRKLEESDWSALNATGRPIAVQLFL